MSWCACPKQCRVCVCRVLRVCVVLCIPCHALSVIVRFHVLSCGVRDLYPVSYSVQVRGVLCSCCPVQCLGGIGCRVFCAPWMYTGGSISSSIRATW